MPTDTNRGTKTVYDVDLETRFEELSRDAATLPTGAPHTWAFTRKALHRAFVERPRTGGEHIFVRLVVLWRDSGKLGPQVTEATLARGKGPPLKNGKAQSRWTLVPR